jgi:hypothetical protein
MTGTNIDNLAESEFLLAEMLNYLAENRNFLSKPHFHISAF